jgi:arylsulfatase A
LHFLFIPAKCFAMACLSNSRIGVRTAVLLLTTLGILSPSRAETPTDRPNIILVMVDDFGYECITANGGQSYQTPNIDSLAASGVRFTNCHVQPLCTPTRVQLMTGKFNVRNYVRFGLLDRDATTFGHLFQQAGYRTGICGKWQLGREVDAPQHFGFEQSCLWQQTRRPPRYANPGLEINGKETDFSDGQYGPQLVNQFALDFISQHRNESFFLYYPMILTHDPFQPTPDSSDWDPSTTGERALRDVRHFADMTAYVDKMMGRLVAHLDQCGVRENTMLVFLGDNGTHRSITSTWQNREIKGGKGETTHRGTHVPCIVNWPAGIEQPRVCDDLISSTDFLPTLCQAAGIRVGEDLDGVSFLPQLFGQSGTPRQWLYSWYSPRQRADMTVRQWAMDQRFKLYATGDLYDLESDLDEQSPIDPLDRSAEATAAANQLQQVIDQFAATRPKQLDDRFLASLPAAPQATRPQRRRQAAPGPMPGIGVDELRDRPGQRPNFLFILTDDQSPETLAAYGNNVCQTPNIDRLAREGVTLHDAHHMGSWSGAVCLPSRTMIMTGRSVWRIPGAAAKNPDRNVDRQQREAAIASAIADCMPAIFNRAGYQTFRTCKRGNTFKPANQLFQIVHDQDNREGNAQRGSAWHGERAIEFLQQRSREQRDDPFLMFLGFSHPHDPRNGTPELLQRYGARNLKSPPEEVDPNAPPLPVAYLPEHPFPHGHPGLRDETKVEGVKEDRSEATIRNELGREYACIENIDHQIGRVLKQLEAMGQLDNTYIFFTSDHGIAVGRHGLVGKQNLYEHTWRVPMIVRGPGIAPSSHNRGFTYLMDLLPTMCDLAGIDIPASIEGLSFRDCLEGKRDRIRDTLYGVYCGGTKPGIRSVKTADGWKLIKYDVREGTVRQTQMFNLNDNPHELLLEHATPPVIALTGNVPEASQVNLAEDPRYQAVRERLEKALLQQQQIHEDPYRLWDQPSP